MQPHRVKTHRLRTSVLMANCPRIPFYAHAAVIQKARATGCVCVWGGAVDFLHGD